MSVSFTPTAKQSWVEKNVSQKWGAFCTFVTKNADIPLKAVSNLSSKIPSDIGVNTVAKMTGVWNKFIGIFGSLGKLTPERIKNAFTCENTAKKIKSSALIFAEVLSVASLALFAAGFIATSQRYTGTNFANTMHALESVNFLGRFGVWSGCKGTSTALGLVGGLLKTTVFAHDFYAKRAKKKEQVAEEKTHSFFEGMEKATSTCLTVFGNKITQAAGVTAKIFADFVPLSFKACSKWNKEMEETKR